MKNKHFYLIVALVNPWIWKVLNENILLSILLLISGYLLLKAFDEAGKYSLFFILCLIIILFIQCNTTAVKPLNVLEKNDQILQQVRMREYPPTKVSLYNKIFWIPVAHWFEERKESIVYYNLQRNLSQILDLNLYFFANHPRERVGVTEFEKFPYLSMPLFLWGILLTWKKNRILTIISFLFPAVLASVIGLKNDLGLFSFLPLFTMMISYSSYQLYLKIKIYNSKLFLSAVTFYIILLFLNGIQSFT